jgi:hypothetical protein
MIWIARNLALAVLMVALGTLGPQRASALEKGSGTGTSQGCRDCRNKCADDYPSGGGPKQTCLDLCVRAGTCKTTSGGNLTNKSGGTTGGGKTGVHPIVSPPASAGVNKGPSGGGTTTIEKSSGSKH